MHTLIFKRGRFGNWLFGLVEGALLVAIVTNYRDASREDQFFRDIAAEATASAPSAEDRVLALVHKAHAMLAPFRDGIRTGAVDDVTALTHYRRILFDSVGSSLVFPSGECGAFAGVLAKLLRSDGFRVRIGQMLAHEDASSETIHVVVEAWLDGRWVVCDPYYDVVFRGVDGHPLGFEEIHADWPTLKAQCPPGYDPRHDYRGFRRVNFGRLNTWLQSTPLAGLSPRVWLNEGAWLRTTVVSVCMAVVVTLHAWYERRIRAMLRTAPDVVGAPRP